ncbi:MAG TPA: hypothetical protein VI229_00225 [Burkholderiales bacterium]
MKLIELQPQWLERDGVRVGIMFKCPHCRSDWLTCFRVAMPIWGGEVAAPRLYSGQMGYVRDALNAINLQEVRENSVVPCNPSIAWKFEGTTFDDLTISPSLDCSASGHWHGFIRGGMIA